jgi:hypothetical protein
MTLQYCNGNPFSIAVLAPYTNGIIVAGASEDIRAVLATRISPWNIRTPGDGLDVSFMLI